MDMYIAKFQQAVQKCKDIEVDPSAHELPEESDLPYEKAKKRRS